MMYRESVHSFVDEIEHRETTHGEIVVEHICPEDVLIIEHAQNPDSPIEVGHIFDTVEII